MNYNQQFIPVPLNNVNNSAPGIASLYLDDTTHLMMVKKPDDTRVSIETGAVANGTLDATGDHAETSTTDAGALSITKLLSNISSAGAETRTLAAPASVGQIKIIQMTVDGGNVVMALTNVIGASGSTSATFDDVGDCLILMSVATKWVFLGGTATIA